MKKVAWLLAGAVLIAGCTERETVNPVATAPVKVADTIEEGKDGLVVEYFAAGNSHTARTLKGIAEHPQGRAQLDLYSGEGYEVRPEHAFVLEGTFADGESEGMAIVPMTRPDTEDVEAVYIFHLWRGEQTFTVPTKMVITEDGGPVFDDPHNLRFAENMILKLMRPIHDPGPGHVAAGISWRQWAQCTASQASAAVVSCGLACRFLPGASVQCFVVCAGARTVGAMVGCFIMQL